MSPVIIDDQEFFTIGEACDYLGGITSQTLRVRANKKGIKRYHQEIAPNVVYYKKSDLDELKKMRPVEDNDNVDTEDGHQPSKTKPKAKKTQ